jgi:hypothetical protein
MTTEGSAGDQAWRRVTGSGDGSAAVEFQRLAGGGMRFRSAVDPARTLTFTPSQVDTFRQGIQAGEFDLPDENE